MMNYLHRHDNSGGVSADRDDDDTTDLFGIENYQHQQLQQYNNDFMLLDDWMVVQENQDQLPVTAAGINMGNSTCPSLCANNYNNNKSTDSLDQYIYDTLGTSAECSELQQSHKHQYHQSDDPLFPANPTTTMTIGTSCGQQEFISTTCTMTSNDDPNPLHFKFATDDDDDSSPLSACVTTATTVSASASASASSYATLVSPPLESSNDDRNWTVEEIQGIIDNPTNPVGKFLRDSNIPAEIAAESGVMAVLVQAPRKPRAKYGKRTFRTEQEREELNRERNRNHAQATRKRKKLFKAVLALRDKRPFWSTTSRSKSSENGIKRSLLPRKQSCNPTITGSSTKNENDKMMQLLNPYAEFFKELDSADEIDYSAAEKSDI